MSGRLNSLIPMIRQLMLSIVLVFAPLLTVNACCCTRASAAVASQRACCNAGKTASRICCQKSARTTSECDSVRSECQCRCGEVNSFVPVVVRATYENAGKVHNICLPVFVPAISDSIDSQLPQPGDMPHDRLIVRQNRAQAILCVWRN